MAETRERHVLELNVQLDLSNLSDDQILSFLEMLQAEREAREAKSPARKATHEISVRNPPADIRAGDELRIQSDSAPRIYRLENGRRESLTEGLFKEESGWILHLFREGEYEVIGLSKGKAFEYRFTVSGERK
jgi:hypothetical protein